MCREELKQFLNFCHCIWSIITQIKHQIMSQISLQTVLTWTFKRNTKTKIFVREAVYHEEVYFNVSSIKICRPTKIYYYTLCSNSGNAFKGFHILQHRLGLDSSYSLVS